MYISTKRLPFHNHPPYIESPNDAIYRQKGFRSTTIRRTASLHMTLAMQPRCAQRFHHHIVFTNEIAAAVGSQANRTNFSQIIRLRAAGSDTLSRASRMTSTSVTPFQPFAANICGVSQAFVNPPRFGRFGRDVSAKRANYVRGSQSLVACLDTAKDSLVQLSFG